jgi:hypothetical protein
MKEVEPDFQIASSKVLLGFRGPRTNKAQNISKRTASHYSLDDLSILGVRIFCFPNLFLIDSLSNPSRRTYLVKFKPAQGHLKAELSNCNCEGFSKEKVACKNKLNQVHSLLRGFERGTYRLNKNVGLRSSLYRAKNLYIEMLDL